MKHYKHRKKRWWSSRKLSWDRKQEPNVEEGGIAGDGEDSSVDTWHLPFRVTWFTPAASTAVPSSPVYVVRQTIPAPVVKSLFLFIAALKKFIKPSFYVYLWPKYAQFNLCLCFSVIWYWPGNLSTYTIRSFNSPFPINFQVRDHTSGLLCMYICVLWPRSIKIYLSVRLLYPKGACV